MKGDARKRNNISQKLIKALITGTITGLAVCFGLILLCVFAVTKSGTVPYGAISPLAIAAECIGSFFAGFICAKVNRRMGLIFGSVCGAVLFLVLMIIGAASGGEVGLMAVLRLLMCVLSGAFGGVIGVRNIK